MVVDIDISIVLVKVHANVSNNSPVCKEKSWFEVVTVSGPQFLSVTVMDRPTSLANSVGLLGLRYFMCVPGAGLVYADKGEGCPTRTFTIAVVMVP